jgi:hypothetical protein
MMERINNKLQLAFVVGVGCLCRPRLRGNANDFGKELPLPGNASYHLKNELRMGKSASALQVRD